MQVYITIAVAISIFLIVSSVMFGSTRSVTLTEHFDMEGRHRIRLDVENGDVIVSGDGTCQ